MLLYFVYAISLIIMTLGHGSGYTSDFHAKLKTPKDQKNVRR